MDNIKIETEATSAFSTLIRRNPYLSPYVDENDKTPVWDGSVYVYSTENSTQSNKALLGRVPTQVKGHKTEKKFPENIMFPIDAINMKRYQSEGGIIFIVVYINDSYKSQIYYEQLLPLDIERFLSQMRNRNSKSISFRKIPTDNLLLANLFLNFIEDRKKQMGTVDKDKLHLSDWENNKEIGTFKMHMSSVKSQLFDPLQALSRSTFYLYGKPNSFNLEIPMERVNQAIITTTSLHDIGCGQKVYYVRSTTQTIWKNGNLTIKFGKAMSIDITFIDGTKIGGKFHFEFLGSLNERLIDADFILSVFTEKSIKINGLPLILNFTEKGVIESTTNYIQECKALREKLDNLNILQDLDIDRIPAEERWKISLLMTINEEVEDKYLAKKNQFSLLNVGNIQLTIFSFMKNEKFYVRDFFSDTEQFAFGFAEEDGTNYNTSRFLFLKENALVSSNMYAENIYLDILKYDTWIQYCSSVNLFLLECLKAYDSGKGNRDELLKLASLLVDWLQTKEPKSEIYQLNYLQTIVRGRHLTSDEKSTLKRLTDSDIIEWSVKCGALILTEDYIQAKKILEKQSLDSQNEFRSYPIYTLLTLHD